MRDDSQKWQPTRRGSAYERGDLSIVPAAIERLTIISGDPIAALGISDCDRTYGWPETVNSIHHAVSLRRDQILVVNGPEIEDGWYDKTGLAVSDGTHALAGFDLVGSDVLRTLNRVSEIDPSRASQSCSRMMEGIPVVLYRFAEPDRFRLLVPPAHLASIISHLCV